MDETNKLSLALVELKALSGKVDDITQLVRGDSRMIQELARLRLSAAVLANWTRTRLTELELESVPV